MASGRRRDCRSSSDRNSARLLDSDEFE